MSFTNWAFGSPATTNNPATQGNLVPLIEAGTGLANTWLGFQQHGMAKKQFALNKAMGINNYNNQAQSLNINMLDRQRARYASNPNAYQNPDAYMAENSFKKWDGTA